MQLFLPKSWTDIIATPAGLKAAEDFVAVVNTCIRATGGGVPVYPIGITLTSIATATGYTLTAPSPASGDAGAVSGDFTLTPTGGAWPEGTTLPLTTNGSGTLIPTFLTPDPFTTGSVTFRFSDDTAEVSAISVTNNVGLPNPASVNYTTNAVSTDATSFTLVAGASGGTVNVASAAFTLAIPVGTTWPSGVVLTPHTTGTGSFTPSTRSPTGSGSTTFTYTGTVIETVTITVTDSAGMTDPAGVSYETTAAPPTVPDPANDVDGWNPVPTVTKLSWTATADTTSYKVRRKTGAGSYSQIGTSASPVYNDLTAVANTTYTYAVRSVNAQGDSADSNEFAVTTPVTGTSADHLFAEHLTPEADIEFESVQSGFWDATSTWVGGVVPTAGSKCCIAVGHTVTIRTVLATAIDWICVEGTLAFSPSVTTGLTFNTIVNMGTVQIGTSIAPITSTCSLTFASGLIDTTVDPRQLGKGIIHMGAAISIVSTPKTPWLTCNAVTAGSSTITLSSTPTNWVAGDTVVLPGISVSSTYRIDELVIQSIVANVITTTTPAVYNHTPPSGHLLHCFNIAPRAVRLTSAVPGTITGTGPNVPSVSQRGHLMLMNSDSVYIDGLHMKDCGRTSKAERVNDPLFDANYDLIATTGVNPRGRYSMHLHKCGINKAVNTKAIIKNCVVHNDPGWGYAHHTSWADLTSNIAYRTYGVGFMSEVGDEIGTWNGNIAVASLSQLGSSFNSVSRQNPGSNLGETGQDYGIMGYGFWLHGFGIVVTNNVAANHYGTNTARGINLYHQRMFATNNDNTLSATELNTFPTANLLDPSISGDATINIEAVPIQGVSGNVCYSCQTGREIGHNSALVGQNGDPANYMADNTHHSVVDGSLISYTNKCSLDGEVNVNCQQYGVRLSDEGLQTFTATDCVTTNCKYGTTSNYFMVADSVTYTGGTLEGTTANYDIVRGRFMSAGTHSNGGIELKLDNVVLSGVTLSTLGTYDFRSTWATADTKGVVQSGSPPSGAYRFDQLFAPHKIVNTTTSKQFYFTLSDPSSILFPTSEAAWWTTYKVPSVLVNKTTQELWDNYGIAFNGDVTPGGSSATRCSGGSLGAVSTTLYPLTQVNIRSQTGSIGSTYHLIIEDMTFTPKVIIVDETNKTLVAGWNIFTRTFTYLSQTVTRSYFVWGL